MNKSQFMFLKFQSKNRLKEQEIELTQQVEKMLQLNEKLLKIGDKLTDDKSQN